MVKSRTNKMHLEVNNDVQLDINNKSTSKRNRRSKKAKSARRGRKMKVSAFKPKALMPSTVNGKRIPLKSTSRKMSASAGIKKKAIRNSMKSGSSLPAYTNFVVNCELWIVNCESGGIFAIHNSQFTTKFV